MVHGYSPANSGYLMLIERLDPATANKTDMSKFRLVAWTDDSDSILRTHDLERRSRRPQ